MLHTDSLGERRSLWGDETSTEALMEAYAGGDERAFGVLLPRFADRLHGYFLRSFREVSVAEDLYQTTLLKVHAARRSYRPGAPFRPWLFGIAMRVRADELRRRYRGAHEESAAEAAGLVPSAATDPFDAERMRLVRNAIQALPESQREVVLLHRYAGLSFAEIGLVLGTPTAPLEEGALRARAFRAYASLRVALRELEPSEGE